MDRQIDRYIDKLIDKYDIHTPIAEFIRFAEIKKFGKVKIVLTNRKSLAYICLCVSMAQFCLYMVVC